MSDFSKPESSNSDKSEISAEVVGRDRSSPPPATNGNQLNASPDAKDRENLNAVGFSTDTARREQAEKALRASENRYRTLLEQASDGIHTYDADGNFIEANRRLCEMLGYTLEELLRLNVRDLVPAEDLAADPIRFDDLRQGKTLLRERRLLRKDGALLPVEIGGRMTQEEGIFLSVIRDVSERKRAEEKLKQREEWLRTIFEASQDGILVEDGDKIKYVNGYYVRLFGYDTAEELIGRNVSELVSEADAARVLEFGRRRRRGEMPAPPSKYEFKGRRKDGSLVDVEASVSTSTAAGRIFITTMIRDITERKRAEETLLSNEKQLRLITDAIPLLISFVDREHRYRFVNRAYTEWFGRSREQIVGRRLPDVLGEAAYKALLPDIEKVLTGEEVFFERFVPYKKGARFIRVNYIPEIDGASGRVTGFNAFVQDVSESKKAEEARRRSHEELEIRVRERTAELEKANEALRLEITERRRAEKLRVHALQRLVTAQEDERRRIARDLHDQLGQQLTALRLRLEMLKKSRAGDAELLAQVSETQKIARQLDADADFLAWQVRPTMLDDLGIVAALDQYVRQWSAHFDIEAEFNADRFGKTRLAGEVETNLYRIAQEALNNVSKHAHARSVNVFLEPRGDFAVLIIEDDGAGFDSSDRSILKKGMGLIGMRERAALVGGAIEIESVEGAGTTVFVKVPVRSIAHDAVEKEKTGIYE